MHRLWNDGCWNKITLAHGCYWHKCSFCDTSLDYIKRFERAPASVLVDWIEQVIASNRTPRFSFCGRSCAAGAPQRSGQRIGKKKKRGFSWWANIRLENAFTEDLCRLLATSGCIAATGGLEAASDRLFAVNE